MTSRGRHCPRRAAISSRCVASRAARPAPKGRKGSPQRRSDEDGAGDVISSLQRLRPPGDSRHDASPSLLWRQCDGPARMARATLLTYQDQAAVQTLASPLFLHSLLFS